MNTLLSFLSQIRRTQSGSLVQNTKGKSSEAGLTLLECVVAIAVIALTGAMIGPPLVLAAATRVQHRRAEQSLQVAQGEVDRIRTMVVRGVTVADAGQLPDTVSLSAGAGLQTHTAPTSVKNKLRSPDSSCNTYDATNTAHRPSSTEALLVDVNGKDNDGTCRPDFLLQTFRQNLEVDGKRDFQLMVRVYAIKAQDNLGALKQEQASLGFTTTDGEYWQKPLSVLTTRINQSDTDVALCGYHGLNSLNSSGVDDGDCQ